MVVDSADRMDDTQGENDCPLLVVAREQATEARSTAQDAGVFNMRSKISEATSFDHLESYQAGGLAPMRTHHPMMAP